MCNLLISIHRTLPYAQTLSPNVSNSIKRFQNSSSYKIKYTNSEKIIKLNFNSLKQKMNLKKL